MVPLIRQINGQADAWRAIEIARAANAWRGAKNLDAVLDALARRGPQDAARHHGRTAQRRRTAREQTAHTASRLFLRSQSKTALYGSSPPSSALSISASSYKNQ